MAYKGYCETDFEPKEKPQLQSNAKGMEWVQVSSTKWEAIGKDGTFFIERSGGVFWARYYSELKAFKLPGTKKLREAKQLCEENHYWE